MAVVPHLCVRGAEDGFHRAFELRAGCASGGHLPVRKALQ